MSHSEKGRQLRIRLKVSMIISVLLFVFLAFFIEQKSEKTIQSVGDMYMHSISEELVLHFTTAINSHFNLLSDLVKEENIRSHNIEELKKWLADGAIIRNLSFLALYSENGECDIIYGDPVNLDDDSLFLSSLRNGNKRITSGISISGEKLLLMGIPNVKLTGIDSAHMALVAGIPMNYINETLELDVSGSAVYSHIIRMDGSFVIKSGDVVRDTYFKRIYGKVSKGADKIVDEMKNAMKNYKHYSAILDINHERRHVHCTKLEYADWFLIMIMPYSSADDEISRLASQVLYVTAAGGSIILLMFFWIFRIYTKNLKTQMDEADRRRKDALEANKAKSIFLSNMSHDIRTPMNAIMGMTSIAMTNIDDKERVQNCLQKITVSSRHLLSLINDVLDIAKIESGKMPLAQERISLRSVVENVVTIIQPQADAKHQKFDVIIHDLFVEDVVCDGLRLSQVLINLLGNAVKFTPKNGSIQLCIHEEDVSPKEGCIRVHLSVEDTGMGMTPEFREKIFESFSRAENSRVKKLEGSGLGMAITKYIIDAMGGTIEVQSEVGKGSCFRIVLDLQKAQSKNEDMVLPNWKTLVVDDDIQVCKSTVAFLHAMGMDADWVLDAQSAVKRIADRHGTPEEYRVVLVDRVMPDMDGLELAGEIRLRYGEEIPVLLIAAYDWNGIEKQAEAAGVTGFIAKPLFKSTLFDRLKPLCFEEEGPAPKHQEGIEDLTGKRVLLAEDNEMNWEIAEDLLSLTGLKLDRAENGQICLEKFRQSPAGYYDAVLMDVRMPVMSGLEAAEAIRALDRPDARTIPIIAMTADTFTDDVKQCLDSGMNAHVAKPIDVRTVSRLLKKYIRDVGR